MRRCQAGLGLLEMVVALAIGLMLLAAASQLFVSAHQTWRLQSTAVRMQDSARLALLRMAQDIRMAGMFGCLRLSPGNFLVPGAEQAFARPLVSGPSSFSLVVAELPGYAGDPDWTLLTTVSTRWRYTRSARKVATRLWLCLSAGIAMFTLEVRFTSSGAAVISPWSITCANCV